MRFFSPLMFRPATGYWQRPQPKARPDPRAQAPRGVRAAHASQSNPYSWNALSGTLGVLTPISAEVDAGNQLAPELEAQHGGVLLNPKIQSYVRDVGGSLLKHSSRSDFPHKFTVLATDKVVNAFALGNGNVYVTKGLLNMLDDEAELAEVIGHEIGHVEHRDMAKKMDAIFGFQTLTSAIDIFGGKSAARNADAIAQAVGVASSLVVNGFGREEELDADTTGLSHAVKAGYDPYGGVRVFSKFQALEQRDANLLAPFFRSHPTARSRVDQLEGVIRSNFTAGGVDNRDRYQEIVKGVPSPSRAGDALPWVLGGLAVAVLGGAVVYSNS